MGQNKPSLSEVREVYCSRKTGKWEPYSLTLDFLWAVGTVTSTGLQKDPPIQWDPQCLPLELLRGL